MAKESFNGRIVLVLKVISITITSRDMVSTIGQMADSTWALGKRIKWKVKGLSSGSMGGPMWGSIRMIKSMDTGYLNGLMAGAMMESGKMVNRMGLGSTKG